MSDEDELAEMLLTWEEVRERGQTTTAEELCHDCPALLDLLRERIRLLENAGWMRKSSTEPTTAPRTLVERYALEQLIGSGGHAQVWRAYDLQLHRHVAVKVPRPSRTLTAEQIEEVLNEAGQVARLKHPNILTVHDVVREGAGYFIVTDLIDGQTLAERLGRGRMPIAEAVRLLARVARAIDYAHGQGVIHRDLKPANIFLDSAGHPHVGDFGLARSPKELLDGSDRRGTLAYSSPEQLEGEPLDGRSDIWSLGVILFESFTGRQPFVDDNPVRSSNLIKTAATPVLPDVPEPLAAVCRQCLARKPEDRFTRGNDLAAALEAALLPRKSRRWFLVTSVLALAAVGVVARALLPKPQPERGDASPTAPQPETPGRDDAFRVLRGHEGAVRSVAIASDGGTVAGGGDDGRVRLWPVEGGDVTILEQDRTLRIWMMKNQSELATLHGHAKPITAIAANEKGEIVATASEDGTVRLWKIP